MGDSYLSTRKKYVYLEPFKKEGLEKKITLIPKDIHKTY